MPRPPRVLVVDHQVGPRECLVELARALGHEALGVGAPEAALEELERDRFELMVVNQDLDDLVTGALLIEEARRRALLSTTRCVLLCARPLDAPPADTVQLTTPDRTARLEGLLRALAPSEPVRIGDETPEAVRLVLYLRTATASSKRAFRAVEQALSLFPPGVVRLDVRDLSVDPEAPVEHDVALTPALVREGPGGAEFLMGELDAPGPVIEFLEAAGLRRQEPARVARPRSNRAP